MSMYSVTVLMVGLIVAIVLLGGLFVALRIYAAHEVESDHPRQP